MNVLFLTLIDICSIDEHGIYQDLLREFVKFGHQVYVVSPSERRTGMPTRIIDGNCKILKVKIGNIQKTNIIEKGISTILLENQFKAAIKKHLCHVKFDLVLYSTPPITLARVVQYVKNRDSARTYLMLKDIFPQNAVDLGMMSDAGIKSLLYYYFRNKEKKLYEISDYIGCMSQANVDFVLKHNPNISSHKVGICPNCIEIQDMTLSNEEKCAMRQKYGIPFDKKVFVYGGNLGKPQDIPFIIQCLKSQEQHKEAYFLIVGDGTEYSKLESYFNQASPSNMKLMKRLPRDDYDRMIAACDVGMIFLDHRFTIPNFPSRLLSYMQAGLPVLACTDPNTDLGAVITEGGFGWWCESNNTKAFNIMVQRALCADLQQMGNAGHKYLLQNYNVEKSYATIVSYRRA